MTLMQRVYCVLSLLLVFSLPSYAMTMNTLKQHIQDFEQSGQARYTPAGMKKINAYFGAAMLAQDQQQTPSFSNNTPEKKQSPALAAALLQTKKVLAEAKNNANVFTSSFAPLLLLEAEANKAYIYHHKPQEMPEIKVAEHYNLANALLKKAIIATEVGQLNQAQQAVKQAISAYESCIDAAMPGLIEQTSRAISQASSVGAKHYSPRLWASTTNEFEILQQYQENLLLSPQERSNTSRPKKVGRALEMAIYTQAMAIQVKNWNRDVGNFERLALASRQERLDIAAILALPLDYDKVDVDIDAETLLQHIKLMKQSLDQERLNHVSTIEDIKASFEQTSQAKLHKQRLADQQAFQSKVTNIKSAFSSKLEQETFENKRQKQVYALFKQDEVDILPNLNGSLMIRAKKIQFSPSSSKVDGQYFEFLGRIKEALQMYPDRQVKIAGHTDSQGDEKGNRSLSLKRAEAVQEFLIAAGIAANRIRSLGFGEVKPIASNMYEQGRTMNRRIDITIEAP